MFEGCVILRLIIYSIFWGEWWWNLVKALAPELERSARDFGLPSPKSAPHNSAPANAPPPAEAGMLPPAKAAAPKPVAAPPPAAHLVEDNALDREVAQVIEE